MNGTERLTITLSAHQVAYLRDLLEPEAALGESYELFVRQQCQDMQYVEPGQEVLTDNERANVAVAHEKSALASSILSKLG